MISPFDLLDELVDGEIDEINPEDYHHHTRINVNAFVKAQDNGISLKALCGYEKKPDKDNPLRKPCCPKCNAMLNEPCASHYYRTD